VLPLSRPAKAKRQTESAGHCRETPWPKRKYFIEAISLPPQSAHGACTDYLPEGDNRALSAADVAQLIVTDSVFGGSARKRDLLCTPPGLV